MGYSIPGNDEDYSQSDYLANLQHALAVIDIGTITEIVRELVDTLKRGSTVFVLGNGGSCANAMHLTLHLRELKLMVVDLLSDNAYVSAVSNDETYDVVPMSRLSIESIQDDVLIVLSGSGNSINILLALSEARRRNMKTIGLLGMGGGKAVDSCDQTIVINSKNYGVIEDCHSAIIHYIKQLLSSNML